VAYPFIGIGTVNPSKRTEEEGKLLFSATPNYTTTFLKRSLIALSI
jgi:hypothetical protein